MDLILFLSKIFRHWDKAFQAEDSDLVLLILRQLSIERKDLLNEMRLLKLG